MKENIQTENVRDEEFKNYPQCKHIYFCQRQHIAILPRTLLA